MKMDREYAAPPYQREGRQERYDDNCAGCGGTLGWQYEPAQQSTRYWHIDGRNIRAERSNGVVQDAYLAERGRTIQTHLMAFVEGRHQQDRADREREERKRMLRDPTTWSDIIDKEVVVTGKLEKYDRVGIERAITLAGGRNADKVTSYTKLLVTGVRPGSVKLRDALSHTIPTIGDRDFMRLLDLSKAKVKARETAAADAYESRERDKWTDAAKTIVQPRRGKAVLVVDGVRLEQTRTILKKIGYDALTGLAVFLTDTGRVLLERSDGTLVAPVDPTVNVVTATGMSGKRDVLTFRSERAVKVQQAAAPAAPPVPKKPAGPSLDDLIDRERYRRSERD